MKAEDEGKIKVKTITKKQNMKKNQPHSHFLVCAVIVVEDLLHN